MEEETVTITKEEYEELLANTKWLYCLEAAGVDNWGGLSHAQSMLLDEEDNYV